MIYGIGTDVCDVRRIRAALARHDERFARKILGPDELLVFQRRRAKVAERGVRYLASRFAAKEAFSKAIGLGMRLPMWWTRCQIIKAPSGKPGIVTHGALHDWCVARGLVFHVSVSDEADTAVAFVVAESQVLEKRA
ncbi:MAG: holo-ACP synthase [Betaproteobacteria bacterium]|nr:holo-ACP synthase [Betaproteobacteria bacterium]MDE2047079.1 holo-ACP synthase [Betaproteobacteria bacterium]